MKLRFALLQDGQVQSPGFRTLGFKGRAEMLALWDKLDADKQTLLLELARQMVAADRRTEAPGPREA
ncbi:hypothetical protein [Sediminicoccus sp. KRV36]|uniref:hypothetical protein n=1 Tax=Sediminicoccus sp. KRV36 TaxID=3133721 RepID=UPI00200EEFF9|nr:hypothetical protein [Sediminicoccus rosea]UPY35515.1 hypothetical protein LHU95_14950 [Sediminicoccus rosea]